MVGEAGPEDADVSVEVEWLDAPIVFVGARRGPGGGGERDAFAGDVARAAALEAPAPAAALAALAGGPPTRAVEIELGAANAWRSVGPLRLWTAGEGRAEGGVAWLLAARPDLAVCRAPVALEVAYGAPRSCWVGLEVSAPSPAGHVVDAARVQALLDRLLAEP